MSARTVILYAANLPTPLGRFRSVGNGEPDLGERGGDRCGDDGALLLSL